VLTQFTQVSRVNLERMEANAIEAAEQCGVLAIPEVAPPRKLTDVLASWNSARSLFFCDEAAPLTSPADALRLVPQGPAAVLIGPREASRPRNATA
jgi:16S rRNA (uracil1498-N3)-methyltransferase